MATDFPDPPEELFSQGARDVVAANVTWDRRFNNANSTNLLQRNRARRDEQKLVEIEVAEEEENTQRLLQTSKTAQDFFFRTEAAKLARQKGAVDIATRQQQFDQQKQLFPEKLAAQQRKAELDELKARATLNEENRRISLERKQVEDADGLGDWLEQARANGLAPGTKEYRDHVLQGVQKFAWAPKEMISGAKAGAELDPELTPLQQAREERLKETQSSAVVQNERTFWQKERDAQQKLAKDSTGPDKELAEMRLQTAQKKLDQLARGPAQATAATETESTAQATDSRPIFKDRNGNRAYKNPDGTFEPI